MKNSEGPADREDDVAATDVTSAAPEARVESTATRKIVLFTATLGAAATVLYVAEARYLPRDPPGHRPVRQRQDPHGHPHHQAPRRRPRAPADPPPPHPTEAPQRDGRDRRLALLGALGPAAAGGTRAAESRSQSTAKPHGSSRTTRSAAIPTSTVPRREPCTGAMATRGPVTAAPPPLRLSRSRSSPSTPSRP